MQNGFLVTFPSSSGEPCFLVTPGRVGQSCHPHYPWARATFVGTAFATQADAEAALKRMKDIHGFLDPAATPDGLFRRLLQAQIVPASQVIGIEFETL